MKKISKMGMNVLVVGLFVALMIENVRWTTVANTELPNLMFVEFIPIVILYYPPPYCGPDDCDEGGGGMGGDPCNGTVCLDTRNCTLFGYICSEACFPSSNNYADCEYTSPYGSCINTGCTEPFGY